MLLNAHNEVVTYRVKLFHSFLMNCSSWNRCSLYFIHYDQEFQAQKAEIFGTCARIISPQWGGIQFCFANNPWIQRPTGYVSSETKIICVSKVILYWWYVWDLGLFELDVSICSLMQWHDVGQRTGTESMCQADPSVVFQKVLWDQQDVPRQVSPGISQETFLWVSEIQMRSKDLPLNLWDPDHVNARSKVRKSMKASSYVGS